VVVVVVDVGGTGGVVGVATEIEGEEYEIVSKR
jgi:hypothetical protein